MSDSQARRSSRRGTVVTDSAADSTSNHPVSPQSITIIGELKAALRECCGKQTRGKNKQPLYKFVLKQNEEVGEGWIHALFDENKVEKRSIRRKCILFWLHATLSCTSGIADNYEEGLATAWGSKQVRTVRNISEALIPHVEKLIPDTCNPTLVAEFKTALKSSCKKTNNKKGENPIFEFIRSNSDGTKTAGWLQDAFFGTADNRPPQSDEARILLFGLHILLCGMEQKHGTRFVDLIGFAWGVCDTTIRNNTKNVIEQHLAVWLDGNSM
jgi:hypothetical protein